MTSVPCVESVVQLVSCCSLIWIAWCQGHVLCDAAGPPSRIVLFFTWHLPADHWLLVASLPASHFVRSLMWSISDVKHVSGCVCGDPLRPMPDMQTTRGRDVRRPILLLPVGS